MTNTLRQFVQLGVKALPDNAKLDVECVTSIANAALHSRTPSDDGAALKLALLTVAFVRGVEDIIAGRLEFDPSEEALLRTALDKFLERDQLQ